MYKEIRLSAKVIFRCDNPPLIHLPDRIVQLPDVLVDSEETRDLKWVLYLKKQGDVVIGSLFDDREVNGFWVPMNSPDRQSYHARFDIKMSPDDIRPFRVDPSIEDLDPDTKMLVDIEGHYDLPNVDILDDWTRMLTTIQKGDAVVQPLIDNISIRFAKD